MTEGMTNGCKNRHQENFIPLKFKGNNSYITEFILTKLNVHQHIMVINICFKFHQILFIGYCKLWLWTDKTERSNEWEDGNQENYIP